MLRYAFHKVKMLLFLKFSPLHPKQKEINRIDMCSILVNLLQYPVDRVLLGIIVQQAVNSTNIQYSYSFQYLLKIDNLRPACLYITNSVHVFGPGTTCRIWIFSIFLWFFPLSPYELICKQYQLEEKTYECWMRVKTQK